MRQLIVNADDFGESPWANAAIILAFHRGIVTSTSLMVIGEAFDQAVTLAHANPDLRVGLHLVLPQDRSYLLPHVPPDRMNLRARFLENRAAIGIRGVFQPVDRRQIHREIRTQVERFLATGLTLDHLDGHHHFHVHPVVFDALLDVAEEVGVQHVRLPKEPPWLSLRLDRTHLLRKLAYAVAFGLLTRYLRPRLVARGFTVIDGVFGLLQTGNVHQRYLLGLLREFPEGIYELIAHPRLDTRAGLDEVRALVSPCVRRVIQERGVRLTTYSNR